jgi:hypothetical protein
MRDAKRRRVTRWTLAAAALLLAASFGTGAETRTSTVALGVKVERHTALYIPPPESGIVPAAFRVGSSGGPRALGNGDPRLTRSVEDPSSPARGRRGESAPRVVVTAFEP